MLLTAFLMAGQLNAATPTKPVVVQLKGPANEVVGSATITGQGKGVKIALHVTKLSPGEHAIHIHDKGVCTGPKFDSAGGHFAGGANAHGEAPGGPHAGDMKNISVKPDGTAMLEIVNNDVTLDLLLKGSGTALVIHEKADDYKSQPSGNAGSRIACGEIKK